MSDNPSGVRPADHAGDGGPIVVERHTVRAREARRAPVSHEFATLAYYTDGSARVEQREVWRLEAGDVLIVPPGEPHRLVETDASAFWSLGFCVPCLAPDVAAMLVEPFERVRGGASPVVRISDARRPFLTELFQELGASPECAGEEAAVRQSLLTLILREVTRAAAWSGGASDRSLVADTLRYIERHCLGSLTLKQIAQAMDRTPSHVTTALTRATGRSAVEWIITGRMAEARRRLLHSDERVDIVAERVGYADATHFIRLFRRRHGATPAAWRARHRRADPSG